MQTADLSWWPKQLTWVGSNFDVGYWMPDNEVWFLTYLGKIRVGEVQPQNACRWTNALKKYKFTAKIVHNCRSACTDYLSKSLDMSSSCHSCLLRKRNQCAIFCVQCWMGIDQAPNFGGAPGERMVSR